ncbi:transposase [Butyricicoccus sp. OF10-2]|nr:transposase [Butyricicoccus sp. OF10-2]
MYRAYSPKGRKSKVDPRVLFKVMVYGYQCGIYSSRKPEEACRYRIDCVRLMPSCAESASSVSCSPGLSSPVRIASRSI